MDNLRKARRKHLEPLVKMTVGQIILHIEGLNLNQLRALKRAMNSCTTTNCSWQQYEITGLFRSRTREQINIREAIQKKRKAA